MNRDVFLAILAMDAYNRGYGTHMADLPVSGTLGNATILTDSLILGNTATSRIDASIGFYASAYDVSGVAGFAVGERVISYRGGW